MLLPIVGPLLLLVVVMAFPMVIHVCRGAMAMPASVPVVEPMVFSMTVTWNEQQILQYVTFCMCTNVPLFCLEMLKLLKLTFLHCVL